MSTQTFTSSGSWLCPAGVTSVQIEVWGSGGAGGNATLHFGSTYTAGGGGAGAYAKKNSYSVTPGTTYTIVIGVGGSTTKTTFASTVCVADFGLLGGDGAFPAAGVGGAGGQASNSTGDV